MSVRMNGYGSEREHRPSSEQMVDLHVYLVPPDIWREKFNNALNSNINDTVSIGFIRVHPETKVYAIRDEIEQQLQGSELIPREYVFLKSVGRSLTRLKSKQETTLKAKNFLPPQAYAPEIYLLEATPEVRQAIAASSEGSTRPQTRTSYDYDYTATARQSDDASQNAKFSNTSNSTGFQSYYPTLPQITPRSPRSSRHDHHGNPEPPIVTKTSPTPMSSARQNQNGSQTNRGNVNTLPNHREYSDSQNSEKSNNSNHSNSNLRTNNNQGQQGQPNNNASNNNSNSNSNSPVFKPPHDLKVNGDNSQSGNPSNQNNHSKQNNPVTKPPSDFRNSDQLPVSNSAHTTDSSQPHLAGSLRRQHPGSRQGDSGQEDYLRPLSATPPPNEKGRSVKPIQQASNEHKHDQDSGIAGLSPETYRENDPLDRRKPDNYENGRLKFLSPDPEDSDPHGNDESDWERQRQEDLERERREEEERRRREEEERREHEADREKIAKEAKLIKTNSDEEMSRFPSPPPMRLASPERETASAKARRRKQKEELMKELEDAREARRAAERQREELVKHAKQMQTKTQNRRNHARDLWKKRYFEEKKKTTPLEEQTNRLRHELDIIHKKLLATLEGPKEKATKLNDIKPSSKVGSSGRPLVSPSFQTNRSQTPPLRSRSVTPTYDRGGDSDAQTWQESEITSPNEKSDRLSPSWQRKPYPQIRSRSYSPAKRDQNTNDNQPIRNENELNQPIRNGHNAYLSPRYNLGNTNNRRSQPNLKSNSPRSLKPPKMTGNSLQHFQNEYVKKKQERWQYPKQDRRQYPVRLIGSDRKSEYFENEQFDSDYDSSGNSAYNHLGSLSSRRKINKHH